MSDGRTDVNEMGGVNWMLHWDMESSGNDVRIWLKFVTDYFT